MESKKKIYGNAKCTIFLFFLKFSFDHSQQIQIHRKKRIEGIAMLYQTLI